MFNKHVQEIMFAHLSNNAQLYKENKIIKYNMFMHAMDQIYVLNGRKISMNEKG